MSDVLTDCSLVAKVAAGLEELEALPALGPGSELTAALENEFWTMTATLTGALARTPSLRDDADFCSSLLRLQEAHIVFSLYVRIDKGIMPPDGSEMKHDPIMRRDEAADYLRSKHGLDYRSGTLRRMASMGGGPRCDLLDFLPYYSARDLDAWAEAKKQSNKTGKGRPRKEPPPHWSEKTRSVEQALAALDSIRSEQPKVVAHEVGGLDRLLPWAEVRSIVGIGRSTAARLVKKGAFPRPVRIGNGRVAWRASDVAAFVTGAPRADCGWGGSALLPGTQLSADALPTIPPSGACSCLATGPHTPTRLCRWRP